MDPEYADLTGVWFDLEPFPEATVTISGSDVSYFQVSDDGVYDLKDPPLSAIIKPSADLPYDAGAIIGFSNGDENIMSTTFTVSATENLYLGGDFAARLQSVMGEGSSKLVQCDNNPVPEPATMLLLGVGLVGIGVTSRKRFLKKS